MFCKLLKEQGDYTDAKGNWVNLLTGEEISTPVGEVTEENQVDGWRAFDTLEDAEVYYKITRVAGE